MPGTEFSLIDRYFAHHVHQHGGHDDVVLGIGDDAAVLRVPAGHELVVTTDTMVAGVHFPASATAEDIGYKLLAVNLSDLAAMGAVPRWASLALTLPGVDEDWLTGFCQGLFGLADAYNVALVGGDTTRGPLTLSITLHGLVPEGQALRRDGARAGDAIYVSGRLGDAGLALQHELGNMNVPGIAEILPRLHRPMPRVALGQALRGVASAMIDISDGLLADLGHILEASGVGARLELEALPLSAAVQAITDSGDWSLPLAGGDDYELCFSVPAERQADLQERLSGLDISVTRIGQVEVEAGLRCLDARGEYYTPPGMGYEHFSGIETEGLS
ncbi:thiamine-phosphate kinase [Sulfuriflexus mobilis]|uniref:thiamine-phosphate kinase n=1 Tax=Sulfuriflexus mobilis TaxID=1811807 RepID=UPI000F82DDB9|nr:thiamine-phosphate kinase [Sulfuriflexus mobilis]